MHAPPPQPPRARQVLVLARTDRRQAQRELAELDLDAQVAVVCEAPAAQRTALLGLLPRPEDVIPLLPEAELCFTAKAVGVDDASWLLEHSTAEQIAACLDLDVWQGFAPDRAALDHWLASLAEAGEQTLLRTARQLDPELLVLYLREHVEVVVKPAGDDAQSWEEPEGGHTLEGQFYLVPRKEGDDLAPLVRLLDVLFREDYWLYFRFLQGVVWELESDLEEWARRWRDGRLEDLGFPAWDEAMRIYGFLRPDQRGLLEEQARPLEASAWKLAVWLPDLPVVPNAEHAVFRAAAELGDEERSAFFYAFVALANKLAVADAMPLGDSETVPAAIEKAAAVVSRGLEYLAEQHGLPTSEVLHRASLTRLFRVGASIDRIRPGGRTELTGDSD